MRTIAIVAVSAALVAAIVSGIILYQKYSDAQDALQASEEKVAELNAKLGQVSRETSALHDRLKESSERIKELEGAQTILSELEQVVAEKEKIIRTLQKDLEQEIAQGHSKVEELTRELMPLRKEKTTLEEKLDRLRSTHEALVSELKNTVNLQKLAISRYEDTTNTLRKELKKERKTTESLKAELATRDTLLTEIQEQFQGAQSRIHLLEGEVMGTRKELKGLKAKLYTLTGKKALVETEVERMKSTYESLIDDLEEQIEKQEVTIEQFEQEISVAFVDRILFDFGKATITAGGEEILQKVGETLRGVEDRRIRVVGHTDNRPILPEYHYKFPSNWELSSTRASAVVRYFQNEIGLDPRSLEAVGRSFYDPVANNETAEGRAQNRRVEIIIAPRLE
ncbi:MAG: OmpA family protein [Deltaproteobacteria bacterium]|nr:OmpA family protein [Deltaproteobacteria bacterium]